MLPRRRVLVAILAAVTVAGIVTLQAVDDAESRTPITGSTTTTTRSDTGAGKLTAAVSPASVCATLQDLLPTAVKALVGDASVTSTQTRELAQDLRTIIRRERISAPLRVALRKLARFFDRASTGIPPTEIGPSLGVIATAMITIGQYTASTCGGATTSSTTRPLR
jgi:hypothetical protein